MMIGQRLGQYEILTPIGEGGMGTVYRARDLRFGREVAVKVLPTELARDTKFVERFMREAHTAANLEHPNIVAIYDAGEQEGVHYIVMRLARGETLRSLLQRTRILPMEQVLSVVRQLAEALDYAHQHGIVHRDIKPANVMVDENNRIILMDFGIAKAPTGKRLTMVGQVIGTVEYMSPEQFAGEHVDARTDLYALGVILYEMVCGTVPFSSDSLLEDERIYDAPPPPRQQNPRLPKTVEDVILRALARRPDQRYPTATALYTALNQAVMAAPPIEEDINITELSPADEDTTLKLILPDGYEYALIEGKVTLGRGSDNDVIVNDDRVSRHHAEINNDGLHCTLTDLGSTNATFVNGQQLSPHVPYPLRAGDQIQLGPNVTIALRTGRVAPNQALPKALLPIDTTAQAVVSANQADSAPQSSEPTRFKISKAIWIVAIVMLIAFIIVVLGLLMMPGSLF